MDKLKCERISYGFQHPVEILSMEKRDKNKSNKRKLRNTSRTIIFLTSKWNGTESKFHVQLFFLMLASFMLFACAIPPFCRAHHFCSIAIVVGGGAAAAF